jgi:hypothetical protein
VPRARDWRAALLAATAEQEYPYARINLGGILRVGGTGWLTGHEELRVGVDVDEELDFLGGG